jgi:uncharacterized membrane protein
MNETPGSGGPPVSEVTVGWSYSHGLESMKKYFLDVLLITLVVFVLVAPYYIAYEAAEDSRSGFAMIIQLFSMGYWLLILGPVEWGANYAMLKAARGERPGFLDIFIFQKNYLNVVLAHLLTTVIIAIGILFLIVPGIIFACKLVFVPYLVTDRKMDAAEAIRKSWRMTTGHAGTIFLMGLTAIPIAIAGLLLLVVGLVPATMWIDLAFASLYARVSAGES